jgi:hypothetical protein
MNSSRSERYLELQKNAIPVVSGNMLRSVSQIRKDLLEQEVMDGKFAENKNNYSNNISMNGVSPAGFVKTVSSGLKKTASTTAASTTGWRGSGGTVRQAPDVYSPLWLLSNLNLPRDRSTINAWCRAYFALNPIVQNAITLHSTYPISKLNIKCKDKKISNFFENMIEELDLMNVCIQMAQEYWTLGEAFSYCEFDNATGKWGRISIQNPDYMVVKRSVIAGEPIISLRPDENLKRICTNNSPSDIQQREQLDPSIIEHIRRGENIPLSNFYVHHIARRISPYEIRGTGLPVHIFKQLMLFDQIKECYSADTEVLTNDGFKYITDILEISNKSNLNKEEIIGFATDINNNSGTLKLKDDIKIACFNKENEKIEYHIPERTHLYNYNGEMLHFKGDKVDCLVTKNHNMMVKKNNKWEMKEASELLKTKTYWKFCSHADFEGEDIKKTNIAGKEVDIKDYLEFLGYLVSEGFTHINDKRYAATIGICQKTTSDAYLNMKSCVTKIGNQLNKKFSQHIINSEGTFNVGNPIKMWNARIHGKGITNYFVNQIGFNGNTKSINKRIPRWVLGLKKELLLILLNALVSGDGSEKISKYNNTTISYTYSTISKQLADDVYEIAFKCGFSPNICISDREFENGRKVKEYIVLWSNSHFGREPNITTFDKKQKGKGGGATISKVNYNDLVWCFTVPTGAFITRRNGKITIQGNCKYTQASNMINPMRIFKVGGGADNYRPTPADLDLWRDVIEQSTYDKDFKIITHDGFDVQVVGAGQGIYDTSNDINQIIKEMYIGLMVPQVIMDGGGDVTYANGGISIDVLKQRYMQFRNMMSNWLRRKVFAPISKANQFFSYKDKEKILVVPEVEWNHMSLFDMGDYVQSISQLLSAEPRKVSVQTLYKSLGLEYEDEKRKIRRETIDMMIQVKETEALQRMNLNDLRSIGDEDEIQEIIDSPLPGESPYDDNNNLPGVGGSGGMGGGTSGLDFGSLSGGGPGGMSGGGMSPGFTGGPPSSPGTGIPSF